MSFGEALSIHKTSEYEGNNKFVGRDKSGLRLVSFYPNWCISVSAECGLEVLSSCKLLLMYASVRAAKLSSKVQRVQEASVLVTFLARLY